MIARHGYITLDPRGRITLDSSRYGTDEGIICLIENGYMNIYRGNQFDSCSFHPSAMHDLYPRTVNFTTPTYNETLATHSLGYLIRGVLGMSSSFLYTITCKFIDRLECEAISIDLIDYDNATWKSYITITPQGIFVFRKDAFDAISMDAPIKGYKATAATTINKLHSVLTHRDAYNDVFDDRVPFVRRVGALSDVIIRVTD